MDPETALQRQLDAYRRMTGEERMNGGPMRRIEMVDSEMVRILQSKTEAERLAIAHGMWKFARDTIRNVLHGEHPEWDKQQLDAEVAKRMSHGTI